MSVGSGGERWRSAAGISAIAAAYMFVYGSSMPRHSRYDVRDFVADGAWTGDESGAPE